MLSPSRRPLTTFDAHRRLQELLGLRSLGDHPAAWVAEKNSVWRGERDELPDARLDVREWKPHVEHAVGLVDDEGSRRPS